MHKRSIIAAAVLSGLLLGVLGFQVLRSSEPRYQGKRLTEWLADNDTEKTREQHLAAQEAVRKVGTNALPTLVRMLRTKDSLLKGKLTALARKQPLVNFHFTGADTRRWRAVHGIYALGPAAKSAVPRIVAILEDKDPGVKITAVTALGLMQSAAESAIPSLLKILTDNDPDVRRNAAEALGRIGRRPEIVVPALVDRLQDIDIGVRLFAILALSDGFGPKAKAAVPALLKAIEDPQETIHRSARDALTQIDPKTLVKPDVK